MKDWSLAHADPLNLTLAADARLSSPDYLNDHIWEIKPGDGAPPAVGVQTTYGLRARLMRLFPRFQRVEDWISDPSQFYASPTVIRFHPNYVLLKFAPFSGVDVYAEYWVPESRVLAGRLTFSNPSVLRERFQFEWCGMLSHLGDGQGLAATEIGISQVLEGQTGGLFPVCIMTGGPKGGAGPYAGLAYSIDLRPGDSRQLTWTLASLDNTQASFDLARQTTARSWEAEIARIELLSESQEMEISSGNPDWDAALACSQRAASALFFPASAHLPRSSFVLSRQPENGYSLRGDGLDYNHLWNGQTVLDAWYLNSLLGPGQADRMAGVVENFIASRDEEGRIDWKPGLAGQRAKRLAQPLLADLAWGIQADLEDKSWLEKIYPALMDHLRCWFSPAADRDQDGFPEWEHPFQIGLDDAPLFHPWAEDAQGVDPDVVESPSLAAMLYRECAALIWMADHLGRQEDARWLQDRRQNLQAELERNWSAERGCYSYRDAHIQDSPSGEKLLEITTTGTFPLLRTFSSPRRLLLRFKPRDEMTRLSKILLYGDTPDGPVTEEVGSNDIHWLHGAGRYTSRHHFSRLIEVIAREILPGDTCELTTIDFTSEDISLLLPLWAGMPNPEQAEVMVTGPLMSRYLQGCGLPVCPPDRCPAGTAAGGVILPWNQMLIEGLLRYGYRDLAADLTARLLNTVSTRLREDHSFYSAYDAASGQGKGERNVLSGMAPVGLFLNVLGLRKISPNLVIVEGFNPFSFPVTVQYKGVKVEFLSEQTRVTFAGGQQGIVTEDGLREISLP